MNVNLITMMSINNLSTWESVNQISASSLTTIYHECVTQEEDKYQLGKLR